MHFGMMVRNLEDSKEEEDEEAQNKVSRSAGVAHEHLVHPFTLQRIERTIVTKVEVIVLGIWLKKTIGQFLVSVLSHSECCYYLSIKIQRTRDKEDFFEKIIFLSDMLCLGCL